jgi:hypothetical protein
MIGGPINVTGYEYGRAAREAEEFNPPTRKRNMAARKKIHLVEVDSGDGAKPRRFLVRAFTTAGAERFVRAKLTPTVVAKVPEQDELVAALAAGIKIEDPDAPADPAVVDDDLNDSAGIVDPRQQPLIGGAA